MGAVDGDQNLFFSFWMISFDLFSSIDMTEEFARTSEEGISRPEMEASAGQERGDVK